MSDELITTWKRIILGEEKSWVLFEHGTCIILMNPGDDLAKEATELMREYGPAHAGSPAGDFSVIHLSESPGWVVTCHHPDILTYVSPEEVMSNEPSDLTIGLLGRSKRDEDAEGLRIIHVEDMRGRT